MSWVRVPIANCKTASIRRTPWIPLYYEDIVGIRDGPDQKTEFIKTGDIIEIDTNQVSYDWIDRKFYKVRNPDGWIYEGCVDLGGEDD